MWIFFTVDLKLTVLKWKELGDPFVCIQEFQIAMHQPVSNNIMFLTVIEM